MQDMSRSARRFQSILMLTFKESPAQRYYLCSVKSIKYFLPAFCILFLCLPFCRAADGEETLGRIPGADMTVYDMYRRTENRDREKSAAYAELFLKGIDTSCYIYPELALMCGQVKLPAGTYTFDVDDTMADGTFSYSYSMYYETDEEAIRIEDSVLEFESGTLSVSWEGDDCVVELTSLTSDGKSRHVTFRGQPGVNDYS